MTGSTNRRGATRRGLTAVVVALTVSTLWSVGAAPAADPMGSVTTFSDARISNPQGIVTGSDGNLWFTNNANDSIGRITPAGVVTNFTDPNGTISGPWAIAAGADGNLWFTNHGNNSIGRITTAGVVSNFTDPSVGRPFGIAAGPDGNLWFTNYSRFSIGRITTAGVISSFKDPNDFIETPIGIAAGPDGNLWFTDPPTDAVARITTAGVVTYFPSALIHSPSGITAGPDGNMWFTNSSWDTVDGSIGRITTSGAITNFTDPNDTISFPHGIAGGPDGNVWFTNNDGSIGRITAAGVVANFTDANGPVGFHEITAGPDGNMWFTNPGDSVGRIGTGAGSEVTHALTISKTGTGSVSSTPAGIDCGATCTTRFADGTRVELHAHVAEGARFEGWSGGGCAGTGGCAVTLTADTNVSAAFTTGGGPGLSIGDATAVEGDAKTRSLRFAVSLSEPADADVAVQYFTVGTGSATPDVDYTSRSGLVTIPAGHVSGTISIPIRGDTVVEPKETFLLYLRDVGVATGRIIDDDPGSGLRVAVGDAGIVEGFRGTRTLRFTVSASTVVASDVSVAYTTADGTAQAGSDYEPLAGRVVIAAGRSSAAVSVRIRPDQAIEGTERFSLKIGDAAGAAIGRTTGTATIIDDDQP